MLLFPNEQDAERDATFCVCTCESGLPRRCSLMTVDLTERERQIDKSVMSLLGGTQNMTQMKLFTQQKQTHRYGKQTYGY